jgi:hypothetical protein
MINLALQSIFVHISKGPSTCHSVLRHGADGFISSPMEGVLWIFIVLKNLLPSNGFEPKTLGPIVSTLTTRSPRIIRLKIRSAA